MIQLIRRTKDNKPTDGHYHTGFKGYEKHHFARPSFYVMSSDTVDTVRCSRCQKEVSMDTALNTYFQYLEDLIDAVEGKEE